MHILILNGNSDPHNSNFEDYLSRLTIQLKGQSQAVTGITLREKNLRYCAGCFGCWVKKPGECVFPDDGPEILRQVIQSDLVLWAAPLIMGFPEALAKKTMDKMIPLVHPYVVIDQNEVHHLARYEHYPQTALLVQREADSDELDLDIVADIYARTALNMKSTLKFVLTTDSAVELIVQAILAPTSRQVTAHKNLKAIPGQIISPPKRITFFNGSPRGKSGNTPLMVRHFMDGFTANPGCSFEQFNLANSHHLDANIEAYQKAQSVLIGFPLYTDAMPGIVKTFIDRLAAFKGRPNNPPVIFLVQSGFPEATHIRHIERYLHKLADRLAAPYGGTLVKGGGEGTRDMPEKKNVPLFNTLYALGKSFGAEGRFKAEDLKKLAGTEMYPGYLMPLAKLVFKLPWATMYLDEELKKNGVFERRFDRPYQKIS